MFRLLVLCLVLGGALASIPYKWVDVDENNLEPFIVQGQTAEDGKYPYQVSLFLKFGAGKSHYCGGSILTKNWILTAAHCCALMTYDILVGTNSLSRGGQVYRTLTYKIHPQYSASKNWTNDICLIKADRPIQFGATVQQIRLPPQGKELKEGDQVTVTGWGYTSPNNKVAPDRLQVAKDFVYVDRPKCGSLTGVTMNDGYLCVVGSRQGQGICQGDSGGPLVKDGVQYGVASWIFMPCGNKLPDFFARVANYINWIKQVLGPDANELLFAS